MRFFVTIEPLTAFGSPMLGETLFGQLCWALRLQQGDEKLRDLLAGYSSGDPFLVVSDAFPHDYLPLPALPASFWKNPENTDMKKLKSKKWISRDKLSKICPEQWREAAVSDSDILEVAGSCKEKLSWKFFSEKASDSNHGSSYAMASIQEHNAISRRTSTTGKGDFAPFRSPLTWYARGTSFDIHVVLNGRFSKNEFLECLEYVGQTGFGRDATTGLGKFSVSGIEEADEPVRSRNFLTLASSFPGIDRPERIWYRVKTHFGRHGSVASVGSNPFKKPLLLAESGAVYEFSEDRVLEIVGQGILGVSVSMPEAVHQGYAPVVSLPELPL